MSDMASDIYFDEHYGKLYEKSDKGTAVIFTHKCQHGEVRHQFIKREIPSYLLPKQEVLYDIVTPYGYGGPVATVYEGGCKEALIEEFKNIFTE